MTLAPASPLLAPPTPADERNPPSLAPTTSPPPASEPLPSSDNVPLLPWLLAGLAALGAGTAFAFRGRLGLARTAIPLGDEGFLLAREPADRVPEPPAPSPPAPSGGITVKRPQANGVDPTTNAPRPATAAPLGVISTRLRPWLEIAFEPSRAVIDEANASVQFDIVVTNSGSAPARQVLVEACMVNAGPEQDIELKRFFDAPVGSGDRIESIPPLGSVALKSAVSLPLDQVRAFEVGGRRLFVPVVAFNALYEWSSGKGQSSASFILGRGAGGGEAERDTNARMAPLRLDLGPRLFRDLDARRHPLGLRV